MRNSAVVVVALVATASLTACSVSRQSAGAVTDLPAWQGPASALPFEETHLTLGAIPEQVLPEGFLTEVELATGLEILQETVDDTDSATEIDVLMGVTVADGTGAAEGAAAGTGLEKTVPYGFDDACLLLDTSYYSANRLPVPKTIKDVTDGELLDVFLAYDPQDSFYAEAIFPITKDRWDSWAKGKEAAGGQQSGATQSADPRSGGQQTEANQSDSVLPNPDRPTSLIGRPGPALEPVRNANNLGTDVRFRVLTGTCVEREVGLQVAEEPSSATNAFLDYLLSEKGQEALLQHGIAFPLSSQTAGEESKEAAFERPSDLLTFDKKQMRDATKKWQQIR